MATANNKVTVPANSGYNIKVTTTASSGGASNRANGVAGMLRASSIASKKGDKRLSALLKEV